VPAVRNRNQVHDVHGVAWIFASPPRSDGPPSLYFAPSRLLSKKGSARRLEESTGGTGCRPCLALGRAPLPRSTVSPPGFKRRREGAKVQVEGGFPLRRNDAMEASGKVRRNTGKKTAGASLPRAPGAGRLRSFRSLLKSIQTSFARVGGPLCLSCEGFGGSGLPPCEGSAAGRALSGSVRRDQTVPALRVTRAQTFPDDFAPAAGLGSKVPPPLPAFAGRSGRLGQSHTTSGSAGTCQEH
jgi:hypothetical protein